MLKFVTALIRIISSAAVLFLILEGAAGLLFPDSLRSARRFTPPDPPLSTYAPTIGRFYPANLVEVEHVDSVGTKIISYSKFSTDEVGRRTVPAENKIQKTSTVFFGCSFTFGRGLNDDQTIPFYFSKLNPDQKIYNYAFPAAGPHQMLRWLDSGLLKQTTTVPPKTGIYVFIPQHYSRVAGGFYDDVDAPYYLQENGSVKYQGLFMNVRPWRSAIHEAFSKTKLFSLAAQFLPSRVSKDDEDLLCAVVARSRDLFLEQFPGSQFVVVNYALAYPSPPMIEGLRRCAEEKNLKLIEYEDRLTPAQAVMDVKYDIHPSALSNQRLAEKIYKELK